MGLAVLALTPCTDLLNEPLRFIAAGAVSRTGSYRATPRSAPSVRRLHRRLSSIQSTSSFLGRYRPQLGAGIKQMIVQGELTPGARIPKESDLAGRLGLSRNSLREAVKALSLIGVLDVRRGDGTYVTGLDESLLVTALGFLVDFQRDDTVVQFLEIRRLLEPAAARAAVEYMSAEDIAELEHTLFSLGPTPSVKDLVDSDIAFHRTIAASAGNPVLTALLDSIAGPASQPIRVNLFPTFRAIVQ